LFLNYKKHAKANLISYLAVIVAIIGVFLGKQTATTGGEVRHTEIRENTTQANVNSENSEKEDEN
jgi:sugar phosphate permease